MRKRLTDANQQIRIEKLQTICRMIEASLDAIATMTLRQVPALFIADENACAAVRGTTQPVIN